MADAEFLTETLRILNARATAAAYGRQQLAPHRGHRASLWTALRRNLKDLAEYFSFAPIVQAL